MNIFFKTFVACLITTLIFLAYNFYVSGSFDDKLLLNGKTPYSNDKSINVKQDLPDLKEEKNIIPDQNELSKKENTDKNEQKIKAEPDKIMYNHICYFFAPNGELTKITRQLNVVPSLETEINLLLKGVTINESKRGYFSEIPPNTDLISIKKLKKDIIINLTSNFGNGGGSESIENRVKQLSKTVKLYEPNKNVYLYINGKEVEYLGGEGVYIKQPLD